MSRFFTCLTLILCWLSVREVVAQSVFRIDSLPPEGVLLDKGWKFHAGDNPEWAKPEFDDSKWESIDPTQDVMDLPQVRNSEIGWFRLHVETDTFLTNEKIALMVWQTGATAMYLNGKLFQQFGTTSPINEKVKAFQPWGRSTILPLLNQPEQVIAVRYSYQKNIAYMRWLGAKNKTLYIWLCKEDEVDENYAKKENEISKLLDIFKGGLFFILAILHFSFYLYHPRQRANFLIGVFQLTVSTAFCLGYYYKQIHDLNLLVSLNWAVVLFNVVAIGLMLEIIYYLFEVKRGVIYFFLLFLTVSSLLTLFYFYNTGWLSLAFLMTFIGV